MSPRRALWSPTVPAVVDGADRHPTAAPTGAPVAPHGALPDRSAISAQVKLARLADVLVEAAGILRELSQLPLAVPAERALMSSVEKPTTNARLLSVEDLSERLQVDARTIRRWRREGRLPSALHFGGLVRWRAEDIERWLGERLEAGR